MKKFFIIIILLVLLGAALFLILENKNSICLQLNKVFNFLTGKRVEDSEQEEIDNGCTGKNDTNEKDTANKKVVVIDPGHGGIDIGCIGKNNTYEKDVNLKIANELKKLLEQKDYTVYMTRKDDTYISLKKRAICANSLGADLFISIHLNSVDFDEEDIEGMEIFYYDWSESNYEADLLDFYSTDSLAESLFREKADNKILTIDKSREVAEEIKKVVEKTDIRFRKIERDVYDVTAFTDTPSILVECNFLSNPKIEAAFNSHKTIETYAKFLFDGIDNYFLNKTEDL